MYKIIGGDQKQYGPVSSEQILEWIKEGRANGGTLVQSEEYDEWRPLSEYPEFASAFSPTAASGPPPGSFSSLVQAPSRAEGAAPRPLSGSASVSYDFSVMECYSKSWALFTSHWSVFMTSTLLLLVLSIGVGFVPILGFFASMILYGPLYGGLYLLYLRAIRGERVQIQDLFEGFQRSFVPLMLGGVIPNLLIFLSAFLSFAAILLTGFRAIPEHIGLFLTFVGLLPAIYLGVAWSFTLPLIIDRNMDFWPAMELSKRAISAHWFKMFGLFILGGLLSVVGMFFLLVGLFVTLPIFFGAVMYAYEEIFNGPQRPIY